MATVYFAVLATDHNDPTLKDQIAYRLSSDDREALRKAMRTTDLCAQPRRQAARDNFSSIVEEAETGKCGAVLVGAYIYTAVRKE